MDDFAHLRRENSGESAVTKRTPGQDPVKGGGRVYEFWQNPPVADHLYVSGGSAKIAATLSKPTAHRPRHFLLLFHLDHVVIGVAVDQFVEWINSRLSWELVDSECELGLFLVDHLLLQIKILPVRV